MMFTYKKVWDREKDPAYVISSVIHLIELDFIPSPH